MDHNLFLRGDAGDFLVEEGAFLALFCTFLILVLRAESKAKTKRLLLGSSFKRSIIKTLKPVP